jgi:hypothetical protein
MDNEEAMAIARRARAPTRIAARGGALSGPFFIVAAKFMKIADEMRQAKGPHRCGPFAV